MEQLLKHIPDIIQLLGVFCLGVVILATVIVRLTPTEADDEKVAALADKVLKILQWLPTIGVNPKTKELEAAYAELKKQKQP